MPRPRRSHQALAFLLILVCAAGFYLTFVQERTTDGRNRLGTAIGQRSLHRSLRQSKVKKGPPATKSRNATNPCYPGDLVYDDYCVVSPSDDEFQSLKRVGLVTLCTQGTVDFLHHVVVLCQRWSAPISVAVYSTAGDYADARELVQLLRDCDPCVRVWVSWHFFFRKKSVPDWTRSRRTANCSSIGQKLTRSRTGGTYPINVGRNIARKLANTPFVLSSDIELYPSLNVPVKFERMLKSSPALDINSTRQVWVLPVFEVQSRFRAPMTKPALAGMFAKQQAVSFHKFRCQICHRIPNLTQWINHKEETTNEIENLLEPLKIWTTVKRSKRFGMQYWEPFFIGTKEDPEYDIRLSWEGKQNKMQMALEMCLKDYDFHVIENAFLVHAPGINVYNASKEKFRNKHITRNQKIMQQIKNDLIKRYTLNSDC